MKAIAREERRLAEEEEPQRIDEGIHSFHPQAFPDNVTQVPFNKQEQDGIAKAKSHGKPECTALRDSRKFLPCHYFDYICGTSTGA
jgi:hypothetical protein